MGPRRFWRVGNREVIAKPSFPEDESSSIVLQRFFHGLEIGIWEITPGKRRPASGDGTARQLDVKRLSRGSGSDVRLADYAFKWIVPDRRPLAKWHLLGQRNGGTVETPITVVLRVVVCENLGIRGEYARGTTFPSLIAVCD